MRWLEKSCVAMRRWEKLGRREVTGEKLGRHEVACFWIGYEAYFVVRMKSWEINIIQRTRRCVNHSFFGFDNCWYAILLIIGLGHKRCCDSHPLLPYPTLSDPFSHYYPLLPAPTRTYPLLPPPIYYHPYHHRLLRSSIFWHKPY